MKIVGHRGARGLAPENTIASLMQALTYNVDEIEIDVRVTRDGIPVLNHDVVLHGATLPIAHHTLQELRARKPDLATLSEALELLQHKASAMIEVKPRVDIAPVVAVLQQHLDKGWKAQDITLGSFSQKTLRALHAALPELPTIVIERFSGLYAGYRARQLHTKKVSMNHLFVWAGYISAMRRQQYELYVYTLNDPKRAARFQKHGLYGVITDRPDLFSS